MADCVFCATDKPDIQADVLYNSGGFFGKVGFGTVTPGHAMVISTQHYSCFGDMPSNLDDEFAAAKGKLVEAVEQRFAKPFTIEYGIWGQSVPHAHTHVIPMKGDGYNVESVVDEMLKGAPFPVEEGGIKLARQVLRDEGSYVWFEEGDRSYICRVRDLPEDEPNKHLRWREFFTAKGVGAIGSWQSLSPDERALDERKRVATKEGLAHLL